MATYGAGLIADLLVLVGSPWLIPVIPLLGLAPLTLSTFCGTDPPVVPTFTLAETTAILQVQFGADFDSGMSKVKALVLNAIWQNNCHCDSGTATPSTPPVIPAGTPILQGPLANQTQPCRSVQLNAFTISTGNNAAGPNVTWQGGNTTTNPNLSVTSVRFRVTYTASTGGGCASRLDITWIGPYPSLSTLRVDSFSLSALQTFDKTITPPVGAYSVSSTDFYVSGTGTETPLLQDDFYCNGAVAGGTQSPCCPPDASTQAYLDLILKSVTLIQRQAVPFAYVPGAAHAGLSGNGNFAVSGILGLKVALTTVPGRVGEEDGDPITLWDVGWVNLGTADGFGPRYFISSNPFLVTPVMGDVTVVGYSIPADVVATITELVRES